MANPMWIILCLSLSDVDIFRRACMKFRQLMLDLTELDPFTNVTIAPVCMAVYRNLFLEDQWVR